MLKKYNRLTWKDINFLYKKQQIFFSKNFTFFYYRQYKNRLYNQISINVPIKLSKKATKRNFIRRTLYSSVRESIEFDNLLWWMYYKIFVTMNSKYIEYLSPLISNRNFAKVDKSLKTSFVSAFKWLADYLWKK